MTIPGRALHRLAAFLCCTTTLERIVEPAIADLQKEYVEAAATGNVQRARALMRGYLALAKVIAMCALSVSIQDDDRQSIVQTIAWSFALMIGVTALLMLPPLSFVDGRPTTIMLALLIPQAVPLAIPIGLTFGIALGMTRHPYSRGTTRSILMLALVGSCISFATLAWLMPASNQWFRESLTQNAGVEVQLSKGPNEMTFSELDREIATAAAARNGMRSGTYAWSFHLRFALSASSIVLAGLLLAISPTIRAARVLVALMACAAYWALMHAGEELAIYSSSPGYHRAGMVPVIVGAWLPNLVLMSLAIFVSSCLRGGHGPAKAGHYR